MLHFSRLCSLWERMMLDRAELTAGNDHNMLSASLPIFHVIIHISWPRHKLAWRPLE